MEHRDRCELVMIMIRAVMHARWIIDMMCVDMSVIHPLSPASFALVVCVWCCVLCYVLCCVVLCRVVSSCVCVMSHVLFRLILMVMDVLKQMKYVHSYKIVLVVMRKL